MAKILFINDDDTQFDALCKVVLRAGHQLFIARNAEDVEKMFAQKSPGMVVLDCDMPHQRGLDLIVALQLKNPTIPILVLLPGWQPDSDEYLWITNKLGSVVCLTKPFTGMELLVTIESVIAMNRENPSA